ncbi:MAG: hypothetical protein AAFN43_08505 [Pseudomonadota bacterium]
MTDNDAPKAPLAAGAKIKYYAACEANSHGASGWRSNYYNDWNSANNAKRMHNSVNFPGHAAVVLTKHT